jgi:hypothetical protein
MLSNTIRECNYTPEVLDRLGVRTGILPVVWHGHGFHAPWKSD